MENTKCKYAAKCGGCDLQGLEYSRQLDRKNKYMRENFARFGKVLPIIGMENPLAYRCKATATFSFLKSGQYISGVYEKNSHRVVNVDNCMIVDERANAIILTIRSLLKSFKIKTYNEDTGYGLLRHVQIRVGKNTGQILVSLVCSNPTFPGKNNFVKALREKHPDITSIVLNINDKKTSMVMGSRNIVLYGKGYIEDELCGLRFRISPTAFYQVNPVQTKTLYEKAIEYAGLTGEETVFDAYCGTGTIGLIASKQAKNVISVELNSDAVKDAIANAKINGIRNVRFYQGDATRFMVDMAADKAKVDVVFMDPPRTGSTKEFINAVNSLNPKRVVYVSCGPESLVKDLEQFRKKGYSITKIQPIDCFPYTEHIESCVLLSR